MAPAHTPILYRQAFSTDVPEMARCRLGDPAAGRPDERMAAYFDDRHHPQQALGPRIGYVAVVEAAVVGYVAGHLTRRFNTQGELQYLYVAPGYRRRGVARELVRRLAEWFLQQQVAYVCVNVDPDSPAARPFYVSLGATTLRPHWMAWADIATALQRT